MLPYNDAAVFALTFFSLLVPVVLFALLGGHRD